MDGIKKQAVKLRQRVALQQKRILGQLGKLGHNGIMIDDADHRLHEQLQDLYQSTRSAKHFQRDIARSLEGFIATSRKQMELARKLAEACCKYGIENQDSAFHLARFASDFGASHASMEDQREQMLATLGFQVCEPLLAMINGVPLNDARHLTHCYNKTRHEFEIQAAEVLRRQTRPRDTSVENILKRKTAEKKLTELKASMVTLGREAAAAMLSLEGRQQELTLEKLFIMVDAERSYHRSIVATLEKLHTEMKFYEQSEGSTSSNSDYTNKKDKGMTPVTTSIESSDKDEDQSNTYFIAKVKHSFHAQEDSELSLEVDDYVIVRQVSSHGWSEGECNGRGGWFPSAYVENTSNVPITEFHSPNYKN